MSKLLIVESPTKARTIGKMLGKNYNIIASMGHIRDLPERELGVDIANGFTPQYVDTARSKSVVKELRSATKNADEIYLAPDPDREGEAIAWHLAEVLKNSTKSPFYRVTFHEITRSAIEKALSEKGEINLNLVDAQQARRVLDRLVGYKVSPLLWSRINKGSSAGRVQSVALRLVVERERAINAFQPEEYWVFSLIFRTADGREFTSRLFKIDGKDFKVGSGGEAEKLIAAVIDGNSPAVGAVSKAERKRYAPAPFTTSTLQQTANTLLHYSATNTMRYAQQLYEGMDVGEGGAVGLITYMRTDSVTIAREAQEAAKAFILDHYGAQYIPSKPNFYKNKSSAQEAHEAIRPTDVRRTPEAMAAFLDSTQLKLYTLIWRRFVASQMAPAIQSLSTVDVVIGGRDSHSYTFRATATVPVFAGFSKVYEDAKKSKDESREAEVLGSLKTGDALTIRDVATEQKFTEPPSRYSEAALIKELEENGIGRPSTYATILRTIQDRDYVNREQGKLIPTELGFQVNDFLVGRLPALFDVGFTAQMEQELDEIEEGKISWTDMMTDFYSKFSPWLDAAKVSDAPSANEAETLLKLFDGVAFAPPEKVGRRTFDDGKFFRSLQDKFKKDRQITLKQFQSLVALAAKYRLNQSPAFAVLPGELQAQIEQAFAEQTERKKRREQSQATASAIDYAGLFAAFDQVNFEPPSKKGRFTYDDKKFFNSLKRQALDGKALSEKQNAALQRMATKYREQLVNATLVDSILGAGAEKPGETPTANAPQDPRIAPLLEELSNVTAWAAPVKRGKYTYDDQEFYKSIAKQHAAGRILSDRQVAALVKMAGKYKSSI
ncbi:MAG: type I DNA topoisomerase [Victivallales bacterium]|jgi:DNA topoisomerase-1|nr:type I DNA topoisomerase [Victivallales bacterium]